MSEKPLRYLPDVIKKLMEVIPVEQHHLRHQLQSINESALFAPPELQPQWWGQAIFTLSSHIKNPPFSEWQSNVMAILRDR